MALRFVTMRYRNLSAAGCAFLAFVAALGATAFGQANLPAESIGGPLTGPPVSMGTIEYQLSNIRRTEQPAHLFELPPDYEKTFSDITERDGGVVRGGREPACRCVHRRQNCTAESVLTIHRRIKDRDSSRGRISHWVSTCAFAHAS